MTGDREREREREPKTQKNRRIFADSLLLLEIQAFGGRRKPRKPQNFRRESKILAGNRKKPQIGLRHLRSVTFSSALIEVATILEETSGFGSQSQRLPPRL